MNHTRQIHMLVYTSSFAYNFREFADSSVSRFLFRNTCPRIVMNIVNKYFGNHISWYVRQTAQLSSLTSELNSCPLLLFKQSPSSRSCLGLALRFVICPVPYLSDTTTFSTVAKDLEKATWASLDSQHT